MKINQHGKKYQITYRVPGYTKTFTESFASEAEAKFRAAEIELDKAQGSLKPPTKREKKNCPTLSEFLDKYVAEYGLSKWGDSYYSMTVHRIEHYIKPYLGDRLIRDIDTQDLTAYYAMLPKIPAVVLPGHKDTNKTVSLSVIEKIHGTLRSAFNQAIAWGYLTNNPAEKAVYPQPEHKRRDVWTKEIAMRAISICVSPRLKLAILLAVACSMRIGEILYYSSIKTIDNPGAAGNAPNGICRKITNRITEPENHFFQSREDLVAKPHLAKLFPDLLNGIHLGRIRRNRDELYVVGNTQSL